MEPFPGMRPASAATARCRAMSPRRFRPMFHWRPPPAGAGGEWTRRAWFISAQGCMTLQRLGLVGSQFSGGEGNSGAFRAGYTGLNVASLFLGGELGELGQAGRAGEVADVAAQAAMRERVLANLAESAAARSASRFDQF